MGSINFGALANALLARASELMPVWLPGGKQAGREYKCADLRGGAGHSCSVNIKTGRWADFASDERGADLIDLYAAIHGLNMGQAAIRVARAEGLEDVAGVRNYGQRDKREQRDQPKPAQPCATATVVHASMPVVENDSWQAVVPVPPDAPVAAFRHPNYGKPEHTATYRLDGRLMGYVVRFRTDKGKAVLPYTWCKNAQGATAWKWKQWTEPRPLYLPDGMKPGTRIVVLVEGERKADTLATLLYASAPGVYCVTTWSGGCNAWNKSDWSVLDGCHVLLWPDCDGKRAKMPDAKRRACGNDSAALQAAQAEQPLLPPEQQPGLHAMLTVGPHLAEHHGCTVQLLPIPAPGAVLDGWDCHDAITADGWDATRVLAFFKQALPLPQACPTSLPKG